MGCNHSKAGKDEKKESPSLSDQYKNIIPFDEVGGDFSGEGTMFYEDIGDVEKSVPYLKQHPDLEITVEVYLECPQECSRRRCGKCTPDQCNNIKLAAEQVESIEAILKKHDCFNTVNRKLLGCRDDTINKDVVKIFISEKMPVPTEEAMRSEAALAQREALLAEKLAAVDKDRAELAQEKQRILETKKKLQAEHEEQEEVKAANETAKQEAERKKRAFEKAQKIAEMKAKEADIALALATKKKTEYEAAMAAVDKEQHEQIKAIMYDIEETLKEEIEFVQNHAELTPLGKSICEKVLPLLLKLPDMKINIESHTNCRKGQCDKGCHLMPLSQERVETVRHFFTERGAANEFHTKGWGCQHPELKNVRLVRIYPDHAHHETVHVPVTN